MEQLAQALEAAKLKIYKFDIKKTRPVYLETGAISIGRFKEVILERLGEDILDYPDLQKTLFSVTDTLELLSEYAEEKGVLPGQLAPQIEVPEDMKNLTLNMDMTASGRADKYFMTHPDETISNVSGEAYTMVHQIPPLEAVAIARKVIPRYLPRGKRGVFEMNTLGKKETIFNRYTPPDWEKYPGLDKLPDRLPAIFEKLVVHLFPLEEEREYFYSWLHDSLFSRAYVFLILCGNPGTGKNRLKLVMRALHGHVNTIDGKKSTLVEKFNSQLSNATLAWFDELHYDMDMENTMKELQNDSISIEQKGIDATRATKIYSSIVISNNKPRDNYIAPDARKFVPLVITPRRLEDSMTPEEIDELTEKTEDQESKKFDIKFVAQIAKWIKNHGRSKRWPRLEYRGPMFWKLAHTSMSRWQKKAATIILNSDFRIASYGYSQKQDAFLWSRVNNKAQKKNGDRSSQFPDFTSVRAFFETFRDSEGKKTFKTEDAADKIMGDFWVRPINKGTKIITETDIQIQGEKLNEKTKKQKYDL